MFSHDDLNSIDRSYFHVQFLGCHSIILKSRNTKNIWAIQSKLPA